MGDLTLRQPLFSALLDEGYRTTLVVRRNYERLLPLLDPRLKAITTQIHPYKLGDPEVLKQAGRLKRRIARLRPDILLSAPYNRTYLDDWLVAQFPKVDRVGLLNPRLSESPRDPFFATPDRGSIPSSELFSRLVGVPEESHESVKNQSLLKALCEKPPREYWPSIKALGVEQQARDLLAKLELEPGKYVLGCPAGTVNVSLKAWPEGDYVDLLTHLHRKHQLPVLLTGLPEESAVLERIAHEAQERGVSCKPWIGSSKDLLSLFGLIRHSCLYLGTDSGPMHFAAALNVPVVALFGGGHWPRFLPLARRSFVATQQIECFGCDWDCWLDEPICIRKVSVQKFRDALDWILGSAKDERRVDRGEKPERFSEEILQRAVPQTRARVKDLQIRLHASDVDRAARLRVIRETAAQLEASAADLAAVNQQLKASDADRAARLKVIDQQNRQLEASEADLAAVNQQLKASDADRAARLKVINQQNQQLEASEADLAAVNQRLEASDADRAARLKVIDQQNQQLGDSEAQRAELTHRLEASEADRAARLEVIHSLQQQVAELATTWSSLKRVLAAVARRLGIYHFLKRQQQRFERGYQVLSRNGIQTQEETPVAPLDSPQVEAFIVARTLEGEIDDGALAHLFEMGSQLEQVLCPHPTRATVQAAYMLSKGGVRVTCTDSGDRSGELQSFGVAAITDELTRWMTGLEHGTLTDFGGLLLDAGTEENILRALEGRLSRDTRVLIPGAKGEDFRLRSSWHQPEQQIGNLQIYQSPPRELLDPLQKSPEWPTLKDWPGKGRLAKLPQKLPSGRPWPKISIVTVTFNQGEYLEETLRSVLMQGYPNLEYLVLDGLSTDNTPSILSRYRKDLAYCVSQKDKGQSDALHKGLSRATGDILAWLNSDDRYLPGTLMRVALAFDVYGSDMVAGGCALVQDKNEKPFKTHHSSLPMGRTVPLPLNRLLDIEGSWIKGDFFWQPEVFWTRSIWERSGGRVAKDLHYSMDYDLWVRMARAGGTIVQVPDTLAIFRMHENQKTSGEELPYLPELRQVSRQYLQSLRKI